ncbi:sodium/hydrogen exchanger family protein, partial [Vibrio parahaemolyticus V-223/04]
GITSIR